MGLVYKWVLFVGWVGFVLNGGCVIGWWDGWLSGEGVCKIWVWIFGCVCEGWLRWCVDGLFLRGYWVVVKDLLIIFKGLLVFFFIVVNYFLRNFFLIIWWEFWLFFWRFIEYCWRSFDYFLRCGWGWCYMECCVSLMCSISFYLRVCFLKGRYIVDSEIEVEIVMII